MFSRKTTQTRIYTYDLGLLKKQAGEHKYSADVIREALWGKMVKK